MLYCTELYCTVLYCTVLYLACSGAMSRSQARAAAAWSLAPALASCRGDSGMGSIATSSTTAGKQQA